MIGRLRAFDGLEGFCRSGGLFRLNSRLGGAFACAAGSLGYRLHGGATNPVRAQHRPGRRSWQERSRSPLSKV